MEYLLEQNFHKRPPHSFNLTQEEWNKNLGILVDFCVLKMRNESLIMMGDVTIKVSEVNVNLPLGTKYDSIQVDYELDDNTIIVELSSPVTPETKGTEVTFKKEPIKVYGKINITE